MDEVARPIGVLCTCNSIVVRRTWHFDDDDGGDTNSNRASWPDYHPTACSPRALLREHIFQPTGIRFAVCGPTLAFFHMQKATARTSVFTALHPGCVEKAA